MNEYAIGGKIKCKVTAIEPYGVFVKIGETHVGLIHISEIRNGFVKDIGSLFKVDDDIYAEILDMDSENHRFKLSVKNTLFHSSDYRKKIRLIETPLGFKTLSSHLPIWIDKKIKNITNEKNSIDK